MPTMPAAVKGTGASSRQTPAARRDGGFLTEWNRTPPESATVAHRPREVQRGKGQRFWTVLPDVVRGHAR